jgi:hypothetical protein
VIPLLLNEVQHQQRELAEVRAENARLQAMLKQQRERAETQEAQNAAVAARLQRLEAGAARAATLVSR